MVLPVEDSFSVSFEVLGCSVVGVKDFFFGGASNLSISRDGCILVSTSSLSTADRAGWRGGAVPGGVMAGELVAALLVPAIRGGEVPSMLTSSEALGGNLIGFVLFDGGGCGILRFEGNKVALKVPESGERGDGDVVAASTPWGLCGGEKGGLSFSSSRRSSANRESLLIRS